MNPHELTPDERTLLELVAAIAAEQGRRDPLLSRTSVLRVASRRGLPKASGRHAWQQLILTGISTSWTTHRRTRPPPPAPTGSGPPSAPGRNPSCASPPSRSPLPPA